MKDPPTHAGSPVLKSQLFRSISGVCFGSPGCPPQVCECMFRFGALGFGFHLLVVHSLRISRRDRKWPAYAAHGAKSSCLAISPFSSTPACQHFFDTSSKRSEHSGEDFRPQFTKLCSSLQLYLSSHRHVLSF